MNKEILRLAVPNIISNISAPLLSTVDTILMGHLSAAHLGAVGIGSMIFNFIYWNFGFLRMGTTGITAQAFGAKEENQISNTLGRAGLMAIILGVSMLILFYPIGEASYYLMNVSENQYDLVREYFTIRILAAPATLFIYCLTGWFFGMQNAIYPLLLTVFVNLINILVSAFLVLSLGLEVAGVAWGTVIAQYAGLAFAVLLMRKKYMHYMLILKWKAVVKFDKLKEFLTINRDIFIRTVCLTFAFGFFYSQSSASGELVLAANVILLQLLNWMSYGIDGFAFASESLVGKYFGANDDKNSSKAIRYSFFWGGALALSYSLIYFFAGEGIITLFSNDKEVVNFTVGFLFWMALLPIAGFASYIWDGVYIGLTASKSMRDTMLICLVVYLLTYYLLKDTFPNQILWITLITFLFARGLIQTLLFAWKGKNIP